MPEHGSIVFSEKVGDLYFLKRHMHVADLHLLGQIWRQAVQQSLSSARSEEVTLQTDLGNETIINIFYDKKSHKFPHLTSKKGITVTTSLKVK